MAKKDAKKQNGKDAPEATPSQSRREYYKDLLQRNVNILPLPFVQEFEAAIETDFPAEQAEKSDEDTAS